MILLWEKTPITEVHTGGKVHSVWTSWSAQTTFEVDRYWRLHNQDFYNFSTICMCTDFHSVKGMHYFCSIWSNEKSAVGRCEKANKIKGTNECSRMCVCMCVYVGCLYAWTADEASSWQQGHLHMIYKSYTYTIFQYGLYNSAANLLNERTKIDFFDQWFGHDVQIRAIERLFDFRMIQIVWKNSKQYDRTILLLFAFKHPN